MRVPYYLCQVCGYEEELDLESGITQFDYWFLHRFHLMGSTIDIMACTECNCLDESQIFEGYKERIRAGLAPGYH